MSQVRMAWLYALHVRSALARGRGWQAVWMLEGIRNRLIAWYCLRHGLASQEGRGVDQLPASRRAELASGLVTTTDPTDLRQSFRRLVELLQEEMTRQALPVQAGLDQTLDQLVATAGPR